MSHVDAALTPRHRLIVARLVVDDGWPISEVAARFQVSWPTVKRWVDRYLAGESMLDRSSRQRLQGSLALDELTHLAVGDRGGPGRDRSRPDTVGHVEMLQNRPTVLQPVISSAKWCGSRSAIWPGARRRMGIPMRARVVACLLQLATVDLTLRRYDTDGRRSDEHRAARKPALSVQRKRRDCPARTTIPPRDLQR
jgi:Homeodomain-like domain